MLKKALGRSKARNFFVGFFSCLCFIVLAVYGWGVALTSVIMYGAILLGLLVALIGVAVLTGWLLRKVNERMG